VQAQPGNVLEALRLRAVLVDELCHGAGLASADMSWYGDRAMLGAVYSSAELFLLTDGSPELADTWQFLARSVKVRVPSRPRSSRGIRRQREGARMWSLCVRRGSNRTRLRRELYWAALTGQWLECVYTKLSSRPLGATVHCQTKELALVVGLVVGNQQSWHWATQLHSLALSLSAGGVGGAHTLGARGSALSRGGGHAGGTLQRHRASRQSEALPVSDLRAVRALALTCNVCC
jgi:hypothetical protein